MKKTSPLIFSCLLLVVGAVTAQSVQPEVKGRLLPQWLTGLIAVTGFLFLTFVAFLVKKAWCRETDRVRTSADTARENDYVITNGNTYDTTVDMVRSKDDMNAYDNLVMDNADEKVTSM